VALPALNEERTVGEVIRGVPRDLPGVASVALLVIDDGSTDRTAAVAQEAGATVIRHPATLGVGAAFQTAIAHAVQQQFDLLVSLDADGQFDPAHIGALIAPVVSGLADFASASRFKDPALTPPMPWAKRWGNRLMSRLISGIAEQKFYDVSCGMRCYSRMALLHLNLIGAFTYTQEVFLNLAFKRLRIAEVPIPVRGVREHGRSRVASSLLRYGFRSIYIIYRVYRDYRPMRFFGGIALALAIPAFLLEGFLLTFYICTGSLSPHKWAGFTGLGLFLVALAALQMGMIGDMLDRHRIYLEELLYARRMHSLDPPEKR
jgi:glycosyltransferase involved in cell wall biosynthesis